MPDRPLAPLKTFRGIKLLVFPWLVFFTVLAAFRSGATERVLNGLPAALNYFTRERAAVGVYTLIAVCSMRLGYLIHRKRVNAERC
jgi:hypothetical protein